MISMTKADLRLAVQRLISSSIVMLMSVISTHYDLSRISVGHYNLTVNLGEVADTVLKSDQKSLAEPFTIHLQDCMLSQGGTTYSKAKVTFTTANTMTGQTDLLKNTKETEIGGATGVGVRILDSQSGEVTLGTPVVITFNNTNSYQELNFKARMESPSKDATPGNVYAQADYKIAYE
ncbi:fimbrial-like protein [Escherichia coli]|uniref:fimbrial-like protein n=1 Tax=Escherichia coli TaxID=562 RepID=UPI002022F39B|nr:fimbrial-like protein [Escherichia coli]